MTDEQLNGLSRIIEAIEELDTSGFGPKFIGMLKETTDQLGTVIHLEKVRRVFAVS